MSGTSLDKRHLPHRPNNILTTNRITSFVNTRFSRLASYPTFMKAAAWLPVAAAILTGCNTKDEPTTVTQTASNINSVAVTAFSLQDDSDIMSGLDSVFFSIDSKNGIIFNADSLPKGTDITKLKTNVTFYNTVSVAEFIMENGTHRSGTSDYRTDPNDTIDFTGDVTLHVVSADAAVSLDYRVKVNVHQMNPDSLAWSEMAVSTLPARLQNPLKQKTVGIADGAACLIMESDGTFTFARATADAPWTKTRLSLSFIPDIHSFTATDDALYMLDNQGNLYSSADGLSWSSTGQHWIAVTGGFGTALLGISSGSDGTFHVAYPASAGIAASPLEEDFPIGGTTSLRTFSSRWYPTPTAIIAGGHDILGRASTAVWGFDGTSWAKISDAQLPELEGATLFPYFAFLKSSTNWTTNEHSVWLIIGGRLSDGESNRQTYISYDNGVNWQAASQSLCLPEFIPGMTESDALVSTIPLHGSLSGWAKKPAPALPIGARVKYETDGEEITWDCPYIYLIGGYAPDGTLYDAIWRGALNRLTFRPIF